MSSLANRKMRILFWTSFQLHASKDITEFGIQTCDGYWYGTPDDVIVTLWYNSLVYQFTTIPREINTSYSLTPTASDFGPYIIGTKCDIDAQMMIEITGPQALGVTKIRFTTSSGEWYGVNQVNIQNELTDTICISQEVADCVNFLATEIYKHIIHFDLTRPNEWINDATWSDGSNVYPSVNPCASTQL
eukprot:404145_1